MPPTRPRAPIDDSKGDPRDRSSAIANTASAAGVRPRKTAAVNSHALNPTKDSASTTNNLGPASRTANGTQNQGPSLPVLSWNTEDAQLLHAYRNAYGLAAPPSFRSALSAAVLTAPGIGRYSPTMARAREKRKMPKDQLALAVRKHFNGLAVTETDVVVDFLYAVKMQDRGFKMRFAPKRQR